MRPPSALYGIIGHPLGHTLSPLLHTWAFEAAEHAGAYLAWPIAPDRLADFMLALRTLPIAGVSVTIPHKERVMALIDEASPRAARIKAVNTLFWREGKVCGENTDIIGFLEPLRGRSFRSALVLGAGGAARAVLAGLQERGLDSVSVSNRNEDRARVLAAEFNLTAVPWEERHRADAELLVNATSLGLAGAAQSETPWDASAFRRGQTAYDLIYNPLHTRFLTEAKAAGCPIIDGVSMFAAQGAEQCRLWTGKAFDLSAARERLLSWLANPGR